MFAKDALESKEPSVIKNVDDRYSGPAVLDFSPDGRWMATRSGNDTLRLWTRDAGQLLGLGTKVAGRRLTGEEMRVSGVAELNVPPADAAAASP